MRTDQTMLLKRPSTPRPMELRRTPKGEQAPAEKKDSAKALAEEMPPEEVESIDPETVEEPVEAEAEAGAEQEAQQDGEQAQQEAAEPAIEVDEAALAELGAAVVAGSVPTDAEASASVEVADLQPSPVAGAAGTQTELLAEDETAQIIADWQRALTPTETAPEAVVEQPIKLAMEAGPVTPELLARPGAIVLNDSFFPVQAAPVDLTQAEAPQRLFEAMQVQLRAAQTAGGTQRLTLMLRPDGLGTMRVEIQQKDAQISLRMMVDSADAAQAMEQLLPQLEARIAAQTALPVEAELIRQEQGEDLEGQFTAMADEFGEGGGDEGAQHGTDEQVVDEWRSALEHPVLDRGQTLHVVA